MHKGPFDNVNRILAYSIELWIQNGNKYLDEIIKMSK